MKTYSQIFQDRFALLVCGDKPGVYADIGAGEPELISNTVLLERDYDWTGILCDIEHEDRLRAERTGLVFGDALEVDWTKELTAIARDGWIDFLSLDLEPPNLTMQILLRIPFHKVRFKCMCIEHDFYRDTDGGFRVVFITFIMKLYGYRKVARLSANAENNPEPLYIEDWWVHESTDVHEKDVSAMLEVLAESKLVANK